TKALEGLGSSIHEIAGIPAKVDGPRKRVEAPTIDPSTTPDASLSVAHEEVQKAIRAAEESAASAGGRPSLPVTDVAPPTNDPLSDPPAPQG
ncbi:MAG: SPFH/Band 7/PHB domain protein, partial [Marmoricola sp.]